jgi:hypothetical protein
MFYQLFSSYHKLNYVAHDSSACVFTNWPAGWGNTMLSFLYHVVNTSRYNGNAEAVFPCVRGYGELFGKLFQNLKQCPLENPVNVCAGHPSRKKGKIDWTEIRRTIKGNNFPTALQLNATFVDEVFVAAGASFTLEDLKRSSCAVHVRFGDFYFRDSHTEAGKAKLAKQRRVACEDPKNVSACFERVTEMVRDKCPDPDVPIYVATDLSNFTRYFCSIEEDRPILSSCKEADITVRATHSNEIKLIDNSTYAMNEDALPAFMGLLSDWLALALAQNLGQLSHSTFSETALLNFYA